MLCRLTKESGLSKVIELLVHAGVFGLLSVIDGVRAIEDGSKKGRFELSYYRGGERDLVTSQQDDFLHDIYQGQVQTQVFGR